MQQTTPVNSCSTRRIPIQPKEMGYIMGNGKGKGKKRDTNAAEVVAVTPEAVDFTKSRAVKKQVSILARLTGWQKKSAETNWVIGEYLDEP